MSYIQYQLRCDDCKYEMNTAFGIVGTTLVAQPPHACPKCASPNLTRFAEGWNDKHI